MTCESLQLPLSHPPRVAVQSHCCLDPRTDDARRLGRGRRAGCRAASVHGRRRRWSGTDAARRLGPGRRAGCRAACRDHRRRSIGTADARRLGRHEACRAAWVRGRRRRSSGTADARRPGRGRRAACRAACPGRRHRSSGTDGARRSGPGRRAVYRAAWVLDLHRRWSGTDDARRPDRGRPAVYRAACPGRHRRWSGTVAARRSGRGRPGAYRTASVRGRHRWQDCKAGVPLIGRDHQNRPSHHDHHRWSGRADCLRDHRCCRPRSHPRCYDGQLHDRSTAPDVPPNSPRQPLRVPNRNGVHPRTPHQLCRRVARCAHLRTARGSRPHPHCGTHLANPHGTAVFARRPCSPAWSDLRHGLCPVVASRFWPNLDRHSPHKSAVARTRTQNTPVAIISDPHGGVLMSGDVLLSHRVPPAVPSALSSLASGFGMEPGVSRSP